jgi:alpha-beta hydrolase superfamily lysophospholipase
MAPGRGLVREDVWYLLRGSLCRIPRGDFEMRESTFEFASTDGVEIFVRRWLPQPTMRPCAAVQIAHGLAEHSGRYARLAHALVGAGYAVFASDHRGHGQTVRKPEELGFFAERGGFELAVADLAQLSGRIRQELPDLPLVLLGHSMGSILAQYYLALHGADLAAVVLSGSTSGTPDPRVLELARAERERLGPRGQSELLATASFGAFNQAFQPARTDFDWLSRDPLEVDAYVADPLCGFSATAQLWIDLMEGLGRVSDPEWVAHIPADLPIYIFSGDQDPVHGGDLDGLQRLLDLYRGAGLRRVSHRFYPGGRHEMLNETNRDEVTRDLLVFLEGALES